jgi:hypothetical protein
MFEIQTEALQTHSNALQTHCSHDTQFFDHSVHFW